MSEPAGWYTNPDGTNSERYWDGARWTHEVRPVQAQPVVTPPFEVDERPEATTIAPAWSDVGGASDAQIPGQAPPDLTVTADASLPPADQGAGTFVPPPASTSSGDSASQLLSVLFDFSFERPITRQVARWAYLLGSITMLIVVVIMFLVTVQTGGSGAVFGVILWPLFGILTLVYLRSVLQAALGGPGLGEDVSTTDPTRQ